MCDAPDSSNVGYFFIGVFISIAGSTANNAGVNLQKLSITKEVQKDRSLQRPYVLQPMWFIGLLGVVFGGVADSLALGFAAASVVTPTGGFTIVANLWFSRLCLAEELTRRDQIATLIIVAGIILIAVGGSKEATCYTLDELVALYAQPQFIVYIVAVLVSALVVYAYSVFANQVKRTAGPWSPAYQRVRKLHTFAYPTLSGLLGAQSIIFAKALAELMKSSAAEGSGAAFASPLFYGILFVLILSIGNQLHWIATALKLAPALFVVPVFQSVFIVTAILGGAALFNEMSHLTPGNLATFIIGLALMLLGIFILAARDVGSGPPSRFFIAALAVRALVRARRQTRLRLSAVQPDRLRLHSCACTCHAAFTAGADDLPAARYAASTRTLQISKAAALAPQDGGVRALVSSPERLPSMRGISSTPPFVAALPSSEGVAFSHGGRGAAEGDETHALTRRESGGDAESAAAFAPRTRPVKPAVAVLGVRFWKDSRGHAKHSVGWGVGADKRGASSPTDNTPNAAADGGSSALLTLACAPAGLPEGACPACFCRFPPFEAVELRIELDRARATAAAARATSAPSQASPASTAGGAGTHAATGAGASPPSGRWAAATRRVMAVERWGYFDDANPAVPSYLVGHLPPSGGAGGGARSRPERSVSEGGGGVLSPVDEGADEDLQVRRPPEALGVRISRLAGSAEASIRDLLGFAPPAGVSVAAGSRGSSMPAAPATGHSNDGLAAWDEGGAGGRVQRAHTTDLSTPATAPRSRPDGRNRRRSGASSRALGGRRDAAGGGGMPLPASVVIGAGLHGLSVVAVAAAKRYAAAARERHQLQLQQQQQSVLSRAGISVRGDALVDATTAEVVVDQPAAGTSDV